MIGRSNAAVPIDPSTIQRWSNPWTIDANPRSRSSGNVSAQTDEHDHRIPPPRPGAGQKPRSQRRHPEQHVAERLRADERQQFERAGRVRPAPREPSPDPAAIAAISPSSSARGGWPKTDAITPRSRPCPAYRAPPRRRWPASSPPPSRPVRPQTSAPASQRPRGQSDEREGDRADQRIMAQDVAPPDRYRCAQPIANKVAIRA